MGLPEVPGRMLELALTQKLIGRETRIFDNSA